ncbi:MAG: hypothetical protein C0601_09680 [Candidatus Muiribacterium halophilum]|uniref:Inositol monophosphatase n=1 Tax=Muiribacterium halophilum TaxID=2053465 RepID=A0A2N5ZDK2_MUIH1|nr:MAG: hypothetical protein C0601_09680 [Candidatus Muirbacterium halophilum]
MIKNKIELINRTNSLVLDAGRLAHERFINNDFKVSRKEDNSFLTTSDIMTEEFLRKGLSDIYSCPILGEEEGLDTESLDDELWVIDPIDGTHSYSNGLAPWTVCVALFEDGNPFYGAVYAPALNEFYYGAKGHGSFFNYKRIHCKYFPSDEKTICIDSKTLKTGIDLKNLKNAKIRSYGSTALHIVLAARNAVQASYTLPVKICDVAAAHSIISEAGGVLLYEDGKVIDYDRLFSGEYLEKPVISGNIDNLKMLFDV